MNASWKESFKSNFVKKRILTEFNFDPFLFLSASESQQGEISDAAEKGSIGIKMNCFECHAAYFRLWMTLTWLNSINDERWDDVTFVSSDLRKALGISSLIARCVSQGPTMLSRLKLRSSGVVRATTRTILISVERWVCYKKHLSMSRPFTI